MAAYLFQNGTFERLADEIDALLPDHLKEWDVLEEMLGELGFIPSDDVSGVYESYLRPGEAYARRWKPTIKWLFTVETPSDGLDIVLLEDSLPDYLSFLSALEPLVKRKKDLEEEIKAAIKRERRQ